MSSLYVVPPDARAMLSLKGDDMGRRRGQRKGYLRIQNGQWRLTYRIYDALGKVRKEDVYIGPASGPGKLTQKAAERQAWTDYLSKLDELTRKPKSTITLAEFWTQKYWPHAEIKLRLSSRLQYSSLWNRWLKDSIGNVPLAVCTVEHIEQALATVAAGGKSGATVKHCRKVLSAIFTRAKRLQYITGDNPAGLVEMQPVVTVRKPYALTVQQARAVIAGRPKIAKSGDQKTQLATPDRFRQMIQAALFTGMNAAELCGLRWESVNQTDAAIADIPPHCIGVREHWYRGEAGALKTGNRHRNIPISAALDKVLQQVAAREKHLAPTDYVFAGRTGEPLTEQNIRRRHLAPLGEDLGLPYLGWHIFRHTCATWCAELGMMEIDRMILLGHAPPTMTLRYTHADLDRIRTILDQLAARLDPPKATDNVIEFKKAASGGS